MADVITRESSLSLPERTRIAWYSFLKLIDRICVLSANQRQIKRTGRAFTGKPGGGMNPQAILCIQHDTIVAAFGKAVDIVEGVLAFGVGVWLQPHGRYIEIERDPLRFDKAGRIDGGPDHPNLLSALFDSCAQRAIGALALHGKALDGRAQRAKEASDKAGLGDSTVTIVIDRITVIIKLGELADAGRCHRSLALLKTSFEILAIGDTREEGVGEVGALGGGVGVFVVAGRGDDNATGLDQTIIVSAAGAGDKAARETGFDDNGDLINARVRLQGGEPAVEIRRGDRTGGAAIQTELVLKAMIDHINKERFARPHLVTGPGQHRVLQGGGGAGGGIDIIGQPIFVGILLGGGDVVDGIFAKAGRFEDAIGAIGGVVDVAL